MSTGFSPFFASFSSYLVVALKISDQKCNSIAINCIETERMENVWLCRMKNLASTYAARMSHDANTME